VCEIKSDVFERYTIKPDLPEAFHERRTRGESGALPSPEKELNLGLAKIQFPAYLHSSVSS